MVEEFKHPYTPHVDTEAFNAEKEAFVKDLNKSLAYYKSLKLFDSSVHLFDYRFLFGRYPVGTAHSFFDNNNPVYLIDYIKMIEKDKKIDYENLM